jgi:hypothetical protein
MLQIREESMTYEGKKIALGILELENAVLVFLYQDSMKLGTLAVALPREDNVTSSVLLGGKYLVSSRTISERVAVSYKKMALASISTELHEGEAIRLAMSLLERFLSKETQ